MKLKGKKRAAIVFATGTIALVLMYLFISSATTKDSILFEQVPYSFQTLAAISGETVTTTQITDDIQQTIYHTNCGEYAYGTYLSIAGCDYYLGASLSEDLLLLKTSLTPIEGNIPVFMWNETRGANYVCTRLMTVRDSAPVYLLDIDGYCVFDDLDGDGQSEIIAVNPGVSSVTFIYFWGSFNEGVQKINVNNALNAASVYYENGKFVVDTGKKANEIYIYQDGQFKRISE